MSKKKSDLGKKHYATTIKGWVDAVRKARKALNLKGFVPVGGEEPAGQGPLREGPADLPVRAAASATVWLCVCVCAFFSRTCPAASVTSERRV